MQRKKNKTGEDHEKYIIIRNRVNSKVRKINEEYQESFTKDI